MQEELKGKWIEALRSGNYRQGTGLLKCDAEGGLTRYCCLGVLCELVDPNKFKRRDLGGGRYDYGVHGLSSDVTLPSNVQHEVGLSDEECNTLAEKNDGGYTFQDIANYIEDNL